MSTHWEYKELRHHQAGWFANGMEAQEGELVDALNQLGSQGWELVALTESAHADHDGAGAVALLKRPTDSPRSGVVY
jgi:uncharacterized protein DUF4177